MIKPTIKILLGAAIFAAAANAQQPPTLARMYDNQLTGADREIVALAEAMPAEKYNFAPTNGEFTGVRTFGLQVRHLATVIYEVASAAQSEKMPVEVGETENGSNSLQSKEQIVAYLKAAFAYAHKAAQALTPANEMSMVKSPFGSGQIARGACIQIASWHSFDHYGQMVVYARMNGVVPPASRK